MDFIRTSFTTCVVSKFHDLTGSIDSPLPSAGADWLDWFYWQPLPWVTAVCPSFDSILQTYHFLKLLL